MKRENPLLHFFANDLGALQESVTTTKTCTITSVKAVYVAADDLIVHAPALTFADFDALALLAYLGLPKIAKAMSKSLPLYC